VSSISTGNGDRGKTRLWSGEEVSKDDFRVEAYGTVDELQAFMGAALHLMKNPEARTLFDNIRKLLGKVAGELASARPQALIKAEDIQYITEAVHRWEKDLSLKGFIITGVTPGGSAVDLCRVIARRAERRIATLSSHVQIRHEIPAFINRLSDLFFILSAFEDHLEKKLTFRKPE
jgi:ATP:cob(I)alamin adenosyltransferase